MWHGLGHNYTASCNAFNYGFPLDLSAWDEIHAVVADRIAARAGRIELAVYDLAGRLVRRLLDERLEAGAHARAAAWDGRDGQGRELPSGTYVLRLAGDGVPAVTRKVTLLR